MGRQLPVEHLSYEALRARAESFLYEYHSSRSIPIPIEKIIEFEFGVDIVPLPGLHEAYDVDGFVSRDLKTICVDEFVYKSRPGRYRFTLAHELSHVVLHQPIFEMLQFSTISEWKEVILGIPERDYSWIEWQAYAFAGLILVPANALIREYNEVRELAVSNDLDPDGEATRPYLTKGLAEIFEVSSQVVEKRLTKEDL